MNDVFDRSKHVYKSNAFEEIIKEGKRENAGKTLPPNGLYLVDVKYE